MIYVVMLCRKSTNTSKLGGLPSGFGNRENYRLSVSDTLESHLNERHKIIIDRAQTLKMTVKISITIIGAKKTTFYNFC